MVGRAVEISYVKGFRPVVVLINLGPWMTHRLNGVAWNLSPLSNWFEPNTGCDQTLSPSNGYSLAHMKWVGGLRLIPYGLVSDSWKALRKVALIGWHSQREGVKKEIEIWNSLQRGAEDGNGECSLEGVPSAATSEAGVERQTSTSRDLGPATICTGGGD